ncbi:MAG TPA: YbaB/EbfC family nucleoid-associated protein [Candidatus Paceibacterota bacterium]|nr:YbaB/EbfC family nucleoid-associated protein [Candidatus Paceibacterota bacterium]HPT40012.1 YbaB/EbfC family nucleoid-associated protein [Candidatus Paceibacterota bacterium]
MFDKFKQLAQMKSLQDEIKNSRVEYEKQGVKVIMRGDFLVEAITLNPELSKEDQERTLKECLNEANHKAQALAAQKLSSLM